MANRVVIAQWPVGAEDFRSMLEEAYADAQIFMHGGPPTYMVEVVNCQPEKFEGSRIIFWKGNAIITMEEQDSVQ